MIDETLLADPRRCPSCGAPLGARPTACPACRVSLQGSTAARLWQVSVEVSRLLAERTALVARLRAESAIGPTVGVPAAPVATVAAGPSAAAAPPRPVAAPRPEWTPRRVQNLLLALGVGLLGVAAVIFLAVSWGSLGVGGRAAVMTGVTATAAVAGHRTARRGLTSTAEALSLLTVGLAVLDAYGARASDLFSLGDVPGLLFAAGTAALLALGAGAGSLVLRTRALRTSSAVLAQLAVPFALLHLADRSDNPAALLAAGATGQALAALAVVVAWPGSRASRDARSLVAAGGVAAGLAATGLALVAAYAEDGSLVVGTAVLVVVALALVAGSEAVRRPAPVARAAATGPAPAALPSPVAAAQQAGAGATGPAPAALPSTVAAALQGGAAAVLVLGVWAPVVDLASDSWTAVGLAAAAAVLLAALVAVPRDRRASPASVLLVAAVLPGVDTLRALVPAVAGRVQWPDQPWTASGDQPAARLLRLPDIDAAVALTGQEARPSLVLLLVVASALAVMAVLRPVARPAAASAAVAPVVAAGLLVPPALTATYAVGLGTDLALAPAALVAGVLLVRRRRPGPGVTALASGAVVLALVVSWSFAVAAATLTVLPVAAGLLLATAAAAHGVGSLRGARVAAAAAAVSLLVAEAGAVARHEGAGWPAVWSLVLVLVLVAAAAAAGVVTARTDRTDPFWSWVARVLVVVATAASVSGTGSVALWQGAGDAGVGLALSVAAALLLAATALPSAGTAVTVLDVRLVVAAGAAAGTVLAGVDGDRLWLALLALGVAVAVLGVREDHRWGWAAGLLLAASSWVRLALSDVTPPEAYTVPPAVALLAVGLLRRRRDRDYPSWHAYGPGLSLALVPSLLRAISDTGDLRPLLLGLAALAVLGAGVARRLQAPLLVGAGVLAVDALVQLAPYLAQAYEVVPRWVTIGLVGLLLLASGATYEQRVRDLRRVGREVARLG